jgi:hypothetical protein
VFGEFREETRENTESGIGLCATRSAIATDPTCALNDTNMTRVTAEGMHMSAHVLMRVLSVQSMPTSWIFIILFNIVPQSMPTLLFPGYRASGPGPDSGFYHISGK